VRVPYSPVKDRPFRRELNLGSLSRRVKFSFKLDELVI